MNGCTGVLLMAIIRAIKYADSAAAICCGSGGVRLVSVSVGNCLFIVGKSQQQQR